jgi:hypothetical protein
LGINGRGEAKGKNNVGGGCNEVCLEEDDNPLPRLKGKQMEGGFCTEKQESLRVRQKVKKPGACRVRKGEGSCFKLEERLAVVQNRRNGWQAGINEKQNRTKPGNI